MAELFDTGLEYQVHEPTEAELANLRCNYLLVGVIWFTFFLNVMVILIILLNFLIAIVSNSYEYVMSNQGRYKYSNINDLNYNYFLVKRFFGKDTDKFNTMVLFGEPQVQDG